MFAAMVAFCQGEAGGGAREGRIESFVLGRLVAIRNLKIIIQMQISQSN